MRFLFICEVPILPHKGGIERVTSILTSEFVKRNNNVDFLAIAPENSEFPKKSAIIINNSLIPQYYINIHSKNFYDDFRELLKKIQPDIAIIQTLSKETKFFLNPLKENKIKIISVLHNQPFSTYAKERKYKKLTYPKTLRGYILKLIGILTPKVYRKIYTNFEKSILTDFIEKSDKFYLLSKKFIPRILKFIPEIDSEIIDAINNPNTFIVDDSAVIKKENILLYVGRMVDPQKNIKDFINIWNIFCKTHPDWKVIIVGDGPHKHIFEKYALKRGIKNIQFEGNKKNVSEYYSKAKIFCMTSLYEGWPMVLAEAMAYECVPVAFDTFESLHEIIQNNKNGLIIPPFQIQKMAYAISYLADNDSLREEFGRNGLNHIKQFVAEKIAKEWIYKCQKLID